ncbi:MAG: NADP-dependent malic enzyme [Elusimicrobiaceae bacterium]|nr:NADP-dependent malic enzyme [Elusimicrobiaceae bacterium]
MALNLKKQFLNEPKIKNFPQEKQAELYTYFLKNLSLKLHKFYQGKLKTQIKVPLTDKDLFDLWYTPGVSSVSVETKKEQQNSFLYTNRANRVAIVTDSTRVLGDGDCGPSGGLGVMEGKALLMSHLGGLDAVPLCIDNRDELGRKSVKKLIDFVMMIAPSFGAVNLEDISQPNCFLALEDLRKNCNIPVWHDDAQGTACIIIAALINALKLVNKKMEDVKIVLIGAGAANTAVARFLLLSEVNPKKLIMFDSKGALNRKRQDIKSNPTAFVQWDLCKKTNLNQTQTQEKAFRNADVVIALSKPGPNTFDPKLISTMASKPITFLCANPVPEIYPEVAKEHGAYIIATGRGDYPNQVNNSLCFPSILKGAMLCRAKTITDTMALAASKAIAKRAQELGLKEDFILPSMQDSELYPLTAKAVAAQAIKENISQIKITPAEVYKIVKQDILQNKKELEFMTQNKLIKKFPKEFVMKSLKETISYAYNKK